MSDDPRYEYWRKVCGHNLYFAKWCRDRAKSMKKKHNARRERRAMRTYAKLAVNARRVSLLYAPKEGQS